MTPTVEQFVNGKPHTYKGFDSKKVFVATYSKSSSTITVTHRGRKQFNVGVDGEREARQFYWNQVRKPQ